MRELKQYLSRVAPWHPVENHTGEPCLSRTRVRVEEPSTASGPDSCSAAKAPEFESWQDVVDDSSLRVLPTWCRHRLGVNEEGQRDQRTAEVCLGEVRAAKQDYPPPNFLIIQEPLWPCPTGLRT
jgi:hypothetical protein